jgi:hypothetical protein
MLQRGIWRVPIGGLGVLKPLLPYSPRVCLICWMVGFICWHLLAWMVTVTVAMVAKPWSRKPRSAGGGTDLRKYHLSDGV